MEVAETTGSIPFQLQFDKPIAFQVKMAEWNPEKDLLAMVTDDSKVLLHRFNWQRLWTVSPGKSVTSLCWRPDGKAIAFGLEDGSISLYDVENGKLLRSVKSHSAAVICLNWEEDAQLDSNNTVYTYEDRTTRFFPPPPRIPQISGLGSGDSGLMDDLEDSFQELTTSSHQHFNILCSGDKDGFICFSIFGIFPIGNINIQRLSICGSLLDKQTTYQLLNGSIQKVALSKNLCQLTVMSFGELVDGSLLAERTCVSKHGNEGETQMSLHEENSPIGLNCLLLNTSIFLNRQSELHQVAQQASSIEDLVEVVRASLSVMSKQWSDAMHAFHEKFDSLSSLIIDHGLDSSPPEEFLSLLYGSRTSPALHQFLVNSLGEAGIKRVAKAVDSAGKELQTIICEHLQPAVEIIAFRIGELRGLSRWRTRFLCVGLDEELIGSATEKAGMLLLQVERFLRVLAIVMYQFHNFFTWVLKCTKILLSEPTDQIQPPNSELVVIFLKFLLNHDPVGQLLGLSGANCDIEVDLDTMQRVEQLVMFGGFSDTKLLTRTLAKEFNQLEQCLKEAFLRPFAVISEKISCEDLLPLYPVPSSPAFSLLHAPTSISYFKASHHSLVDYVCFRMPEESLELMNYVGVIRGFSNYKDSIENGETGPDGVLLCIPDEYHCVDVALYKDNQIVLLLNEAISSTEIPERSWMMMIETNGLPFEPLSRSRSAVAGFWKLLELKDLAVNLSLEIGKVRCIPHLATAPLALSASRGVACVFASRKHAMVYILDEDEDESSDME
ncbi:anaphase-promoting complex subunit 4 isoform X1 [Dioscorea cayenensis subsp. rotundata]|uniref:Anaphase-promoting complex subunit 4 n=2 Tax=Dioscorea cayennensis subsp. rotundata TaxID=55577 RepID=A0AB40AL18_DIOCR|nr:anaphase-promoting complex subunit 4 isoform X1 [Dioscorea cayenensis subsp. rotundata]